MKDIFLSYSTDDRERVRPLIGRLEEAGWSVWWDREIPAGRQWDQVIEDALAHTRAVVVVWTESSVDSRWVRTEAREGLRQDVLVPIRMDDAPLPLEFQSTQTADLRRWSETADPDGGFDDLERGLREMMIAPAPRETPEPVQPDPGAGCSISGVVANALDPEEGTGAASMAGVVLDLQELSTGNTVATTVTDMLGAYRFKHLPPGSYRVRAVSPANATVVRGIAADGRIKNVALLVVSELRPHAGTASPPVRPGWNYESLEPANLGPADFVFLMSDCAIHGIVLQAGQPVSGARVEMGMLGAVEPSPHILAVQADAEGRFIVGGLLEGIYRLRLRLDDEAHWPIVRICFVRRDQRVGSATFELGT